MLGMHAISTNPISSSSLVSYTLAASAVTAVPNDITGSFAASATLSSTVVTASNSALTPTLQLVSVVPTSKVKLCKSHIKGAFKSSIDAVITNCSKTCRIYYPPKHTSCANCQYDPIGHKSANRYLHGGPIPFRAGSLCPLCNGVGYRAEETFSTVEMLVYFKPREFHNLPNNMQLAYPDSIIMTKCLISELSKIRRANYILINVDEDGLIHRRYKRISDPVPNGFDQDRYILTLWQKL